MSRSESRKEQNKFSNEREVIEAYGSVRSCNLRWDPCVEKCRMGMNLHQSYRAGVRYGLEQQFITNSNRLSQNEAETERKV